MTTETLDISEAGKQLITLDKRLREKHVIMITKDNKGAFVAVDPDYFSALLETLEILSDPQALKMLEDSQADVLAGRLQDHQDVKRELN